VQLHIRKSIHPVGVVDFVLAQSLASARAVQGMPGATNFILSGREGYVLNHERLLDEDIRVQAATLLKK
jgi:hypothetical protein